MNKYENRIVIITRETRLEKVLAAQNTISQARFYVKQLGADFDEYETEHTQYNNSVQMVRRNLHDLGKIQVLDRRYLPNFVFAPDDIIVAVGQDGLVANTMKYLDDQAIIGVNPDPGRWDGVLLPFKPTDAVKIVSETIEGKRKIEEVTMAKARVQNGQELLAVNDFFIGQRGHTSARYIIKFKGNKEPQSSSGVIVSTGLGSTGWMKSILAGAKRISSSVIGNPLGFDYENENLVEADMKLSRSSKIEEASMPMPAQEVYADEEILEQPAVMDIRDFKETEKRASASSKSKMMKRPIKKSYGMSELQDVMGKWGSTELVFAVREPFPSKSTGATLVFGKISEREPLRIESLMGENGVIFSDGIEQDYISFNSGMEVTIGLAGKKGHMVI